MTDRTAPQLLTPGKLAEELDVPLHRVVHLLATREHIQPAARAGIIRLYSKEVIALLKSEILLQDRRRHLTEVRCAQ